MIAIAIIGYAILAIYDYVPLYKQKLWGDFWVNIAFGVLSFIVALLLCFNVKIPSPAKPIQHLITLIIGR